MTASSKPLIPAETTWMTRRQGQRSAEKPGRHVVLAVTKRGGQRSQYSSFSQQMVFPPHSLPSLSLSTVSVTPSCFIPFTHNHPQSLSLKKKFRSGFVQNVVIGNEVGTVKVFIRTKQRLVFKIPSRQKKKRHNLHYPDFRKSSVQLHVEVSSPYCCLTLRF